MLITAEKTSQFQRVRFMRRYRSKNKHQGLKASNIRFYIQYCLKTLNRAVYGKVTIYKQKVISTGIHKLLSSSFLAR